MNLTEFVLTVERKKIYNMNFGNRLKMLRNITGVTQRELASAIDVERATIAGYETRSSEPNYEKLIRISKFFNVSVDYLLGNDEIIKSTSYKLPILKNNNETFQQTLEYVVVDEALKKNRDLLAMKINDDSLSPKFNKDSIVILENTNEISDGDLVLCLLNDEKTYLRYFIQSDKVILYGENSNTPPLIVENENIKILGRALEIRISL